MRVCNINELRMYVSVSVGMCVCIGLAGPGRRRGLASGRNLDSVHIPVTTCQTYFVYVQFPMSSSLLPQEIRITVYYNVLVEREARAHSCSL